MVRPQFEPPQVWFTRWATTIAAAAVGMIMYSSRGSYGLGSMASLIPALRHSRFTATRASVNHSSDCW